MLTCTHKKNNPNLKLRGIYIKIKTYISKIFLSDIQTKNAVVYLDSMQFNMHENIMESC